MVGWALLKWLLWVCLYVIPVVCVPWALSRSWGRQHGRDLRPNLRELFQRGELGLVGLVLVIPAIWEALQSQFMPPTIVLACVLLGVGGAMAGMVWVECYCRQTTGEACYRGRVWRDSRNIAILVFSMVAVIEILLDRFAKVVSQ